MPGSIMIVFSQRMLFMYLEQWTNQNMDVHFSISNSDQAVLSCSCALDSLGNKIVQDEACSLPILHTEYIMLKYVK